MNPGVCALLHLITSPEALAFVAEHSRGRLVDPMAGTGWWAYLLSELADVDTVRYDVEPGTNEYHGGRPLWCPIVRRHREPPKETPGFSHGEECGSAASAAQG